MKSSIFAVLIIAASLFASCKNDLELDGKYTKRVLSVNGYINADSTLNRLLVAWTDRNHPIPINDATLQITVNGQPRQTIGHSSDEEGNYLIDGKLNPGDHVRIDVTTADRSQHAYIEDIVPQPIEKIDELKAEFVKNVRYIANNGMRSTADMYKIALQFRDNARTDYYRLTTTIYQTIKQRKVYPWEPDPQEPYQYKEIPPSTDYVATEDPVMMEGKVLTPNSDFDFANGGSIVNRYGIFNDLAFNGTDCRINIYQQLDMYTLLNEPESPLTYSVDLGITLSSFTPTAYYYLKAMNMRRSSYYEDNNDLTGPIKMPSNVNGGTGIVGFYTSRNLPIHIYGPERYPGLYN